MSARTTTTIDPDVADVLRRCSISTDRIALPSEQLDRDLYERVNKVLAMYGGKWNRSAKAHLFASDPRTKFAEVLETGIATDAKKVNQAYYTPGHVAEHMVTLLDIQAHDRVLEPSAGTGNIADALYDRYQVRAECVEFDLESVNILVAKGYTVYHSDFLALSTKWFLDGQSWNKIAMNPPFSKNQDIKHVLAAYRVLAPGGTLVAIMSGGVLTGQTALHDALRTTLAAENSSHEYIEAGAFKESGTQVSTVLVVIHKAKS